jgi:hypothetical protein
MSYATRIQFIGTKQELGNSLTHKILVKKKDYSGSIADIELDPSQGSFEHIHEQLDPKDPFKKHLLKSRFKLYMLVNPNMSYDGQALGEDIFSAGEDDYKLEYYVENALVFTGWVLPDMLSFSAGKETYTLTITAKDLTRLGEFDFAPRPTITQTGTHDGIAVATISDRSKVIQLIAGMLDNLDLQLDIYSYTTWSQDDINHSNDFLQQIYAKASNEAGEDNPKKCDEVLKDVLASFGLFIRQMNGAWELFQYSAWEDSTTVSYTQYNHRGVHVGDGTKNLLTDLNVSDKFLLPNSSEQANPAYKTVKTALHVPDGVDELKLKDKNFNVVDELTIPDESAQTNYTTSKYAYTRQTGTNKLHLEFTVDVCFKENEGQHFLNYIPFFYLYNGSDFLHAEGYVVISEFERHIYDGVNSHLNWKSKKTNHQNEIGIQFTSSDEIEDPDYYKHYRRSISMDVTLPDASFGGGDFFMKFGASTFRYRTGLFNHHHHHHADKTDFSGVYAEVYQGTSPTGTNNIITKAEDQDVILLKQPSGADYFKFRPLPFIKKDNMEFRFEMKFLPHATGGSGTSGSFPIYAQITIGASDGSYYHLTQHFFGEECSWVKSTNLYEAFNYTHPNYDNPDWIKELNSLDYFVIRRGIRVTYHGDNKGAQNYYPFQVQSGGLPPDIVLNSKIYVSLYLPQKTSNGWKVDQIQYKEISLKSHVIGDDKQNKDAIHFQVEQDGNYSTNYDYGEVKYGDGPVATAKSALAYRDSSGEFVDTYQNWGFRGDSAFDRNIDFVLAQEIMSVRRKETYTYSYTIRGAYNIENIIEYEGQYLFYIGGTYTYANNEYDNHYMQLNISKSSSDSNYSHEAPGGAAIPPPTWGGNIGNQPFQDTGKGLHVPDHDLEPKLGDGLAFDNDNNITADDSHFDGRYLQIANELSEITQVKGPKEFLGQVSFDKQYVDFANAGNTGLRVERSSDQYFFWNEAAHDWGKKSGASGAFDKALFKKDLFPNDSIQGLGASDEVDFASLNLSTFTQSHQNESNVLFGSDGHGTLDVTSWASKDAIRKSGFYFKDGMLLHMEHPAGAASFQMFASGNQLQYRTRLGTWGDTFNVYGDAQDIVHPYKLSVDQLTTLNDDLQLGTLLESKAGYTSGILGSGTRLDTNANGSGATFFEVDNMRIRNALHVHIFVKDEVRAVNGYLMITDSALISSDASIAAGTAGQTIQIQKDNKNSTFEVGDLLWAKNIQMGTGLQVSGVQVKVTAVDTSNADYTMLTVTSQNGGHGGELKDGDSIVRVSGGYIMNTASGQYSPFISVYDGISSWSDFQSVSKEKVRLGNLDGHSLANGYGLITKNAYFTDYALLGDLTKAGNYLEYANGNLSANLNDLYIKANGLLLDTVNEQYKFTGEITVTGGNAAKTSDLFSGKYGDLSGSKPPANADATNYGDQRIANNSDDSGLALVPYPQGARLRLPSGSHTGALVVALPAAGYSESTRLQFTVNVIDHYSGNFKLNITGYWINDSWHDMNVGLVGSTAADNRVRFARDASRAYIIIGSSGSSWLATQVSVSNFMAGYTVQSVSTWDDGWTIDIQSDVSGYTVDKDYSNALVDAGFAKSSDTVANQLGLGTIANWLGTQQPLGKTLIATKNGVGYINTDVLLVDEIFGTDETITGTLKVGGDAHVLDGVNDTVTLAGGIFAANPESIDLAGFNVNNEAIYGDISGHYLAFGKNQAWNSSVVGLQVGTDARNRVFIGTSSSQYWLAAVDNGEYAFKITKDEKLIAGAHFDASHMWGGGDGTYADATVKFDFSKGEIYYGAMTQVIHSFSEIGSISGIQKMATVSAPLHGNGATDHNLSNPSTTKPCMQARYFHRHGFNSINVSGIIDISNYTNNGSSNGQIKQTKSQHRLTIKIENASGSVVVNKPYQTGWKLITGNGKDEFNFDIDISGLLTDNAFYMVKVYLHCEAKGQYYGTSAQSFADASWDVNLMKDIKILATT